ncbi:unnamed protein product [Spirodela intermedia]|uniref:SHSP domain-containing protein n=1 Tax=Spirodela intermedia TaxID=51605 RepID=A0A7I8KRZ3_SPIIN|nr:unnamed protein product [Spirodela intermedia]
MKIPAAVFLPLFLFLFLFLLLLAPAAPAAGSLRPFFDHRRSSAPEHLPWDLDLDDLAAVFHAVRVDWMETAAAHIVTVDVPGEAGAEDKSTTFIYFLFMGGAGFKKEELKVELEEEGGVLKVAGERRREAERKEGGGWHCAERAHGKFWRRLRMPENADVALARATLDNGVLTIALSKLPPQQIKHPCAVHVSEEKAAAAVERKKVEL